MSSLKGLTKSAPSTYKHFFKEELEVPFLHEWLSELSSGQAASSVGYNEFSHVGESSKLWKVLLVYWLFKKGKLHILGKLRLG